MKLAFNRKPLLMSKFAVPQGPASIVIKVVIAVLAMAFIKEQSAQLTSLVWEAGDLRQNGAVIFSFWLSLLAPGLYLIAAWAAADVLGRLNKGTPFTPSLIKGVREVGRNLMWGAVAAIVLVPTMTPWADDRFRGMRYDPDIESVTIGLVGVVLYILAKQGQSLKAELEQFV